MNGEEKIKIDYLDETKSLEERRALYKVHMDEMMNPVPPEDFDPDNFKPAGDDLEEVANRKRVNPPKILPTFGIKPKEIREGQMIGMFESKQDIYLIMAHRINELQAEIELLKSK